MKGRRFARGLYSLTLVTVITGDGMRGRIERFDRLVCCWHRSFG